MSLIPRKIAPAWSCQPPPVVSICSIARVRLNSTLPFQPSPHRSPSVASSVAARMLLVPRPDPFGTAHSIDNSMPPPNARSCSSNEAKPPCAWKRGTKPASANAALASANSLPGCPQVSSSS